MPYAYFGAAIRELFEWGTQTGTSTTSGDKILGTEAKRIDSMLLQRSYFVEVLHWNQLPEAVDIVSGGGALRSSR